MLVLAVFIRVCNEGASIAFCHGVYARIGISCGAGYLKREQEPALKQLYDEKDVAVLPPGFGKDRIY